jgi:hypothetical protein
MLHLTSGAFKALARNYSKSRRAARSLRCTACSAALEGEIPHTVTQALAAFLEASGIALGGPGNEPFIRRGVAQLRACVEYLQHSIRIGLPIGGKAQYPPAAQPVGDQLNERRLDQPPFVVPFLRPRVWKQDQHLSQRSRCNLMDQDFNGIVADDARVVHLPFFQAQHQAPDTRPVNLNTEKVAVGVSCCLGSEVVTVTETDLQGDGRGSPESGLEIEGRRFEGDTKFGPQKIQRPLLCFCDPTTAHHE